MYNEEAYFLVVLQPLNQVDSLPNTAKAAVQLTEAAEKHEDSSDASTDVHPEDEPVLATGEMRSLQQPPSDSVTSAHAELSASSQENLRGVVSEGNLQESPPLSKAVAELKATGKPKFGKPSPLVTAPTAPPSLSRTSSAETPQSPFTIPRNPFLSLVGKMPKFQWSSGHITLLEDLLRSLQKIMNKWKR